MAATSRVVCLPWMRHFSTSTATYTKLIQPPIAVFGIEGRYATAIYSAAAKEKKLDAVEGELKKIKSLMQKDMNLAEFIANPLIKISLKKDGLASALQKQKFSSLTINLIGAMAENRRLNKLDSVINSFSRIMSAQRGEVACEVITAKPLDTATSKDLETALQGFLKKGETLLMQTKVDPSIIGGMIVSIGDKYVDMSMATKIKTYNQLIKEAI
ncbi:ATP synthase subunit O, mitochondrial-like [Limulus polyphemus]|uniref:Oligomycin sensitivity conferral protein n=1 Tax=Limulus polyphemus TaxID=6850 RepID=A0ABM1BFQ7_LIMPO|nr:ATP synthase subunit O, mitochondrial-like [Limulus polyphemus]